MGGLTARLAPDKPTPISILAEAGNAELDDASMSSKTVRGWMKYMPGDNPFAELRF